MGRKPPLCRREVVPAACRLHFQIVQVFPPQPLPIIIIILAFPKHSWHNLKQPSPALTQPERTRHLQYGTPGILTLIKVNL